MQPSITVESHTPDPEAFMAHAARVSNPSNQDNPEYERLLEYCIRHGHWSVFEHAHMTLRIVTTLAIATQLLRHRSFTFQQLSRRYAGNGEAPMEYLVPELRAPHPKNRQASEDTLPIDIKRVYSKQVADHLAQGQALYHRLLEVGVAKECARAVLPQATITTLYMTGNCRSWIHYIALRSETSTQSEHRDVAFGVARVFKTVFPTCYEALNKIHWTFS